MIHLIFDVRRFDVVGRDFNSRRQELLSQFRASVEMRGDVDARIELAGEEEIRLSRVSGDSRSK